MSLINDLTVVRLEPGSVIFTFDGFVNTSTEASAVQSDLQNAIGPGSSTNDLILAPNTVPQISGLRIIVNYDVLFTYLPGIAQWLLILLSLRDLLLFLLTPTFEWDDCGCPTKLAPRKDSAPAFIEHIGPFPLKGNFTDLGLYISISEIQDKSEDKNEVTRDEYLVQYPINIRHTLDNGIHSWINLILFWWHDTGMPSCMYFHVHILYSYIL